jgi:hypothetical protein
MSTAKKYSVFLVRSRRLSVAQGTPDQLESTYVANRLRATSVEEAVKLAKQEVLDSDLEDPPEDGFLGLEGEEFKPDLSDYRMLWVTEGWANVLRYGWQT